MQTSACSARCRMPIFAVMTACCLRTVPPPPRPTIVWLRRFTTFANALALSFDRNRLSPSSTAASAKCRQRPDHEPSLIQHAPFACRRSRRHSHRDPSHHPATPPPSFLLVHPSLSPPPPRPA